MNGLILIHWQLLKLLYDSGQWWGRCFSFYPSVWFYVKRTFRDQTMVLRAWAIVIRAMGGIFVGPALSMAGYRGSVFCMFVRLSIRQHFCQLRPSVNPNVQVCFSRTTRVMKFRKGLHLGMTTNMHVHIFPYLTLSYICRFPHLTLTYISHFIDSVNCVNPNV